MFILSCVDIEFKCVQLGVYTVLTSTPLWEEGGWGVDQSRLEIAVQTSLVQKPVTPNKILLCVYHLSHESDVCSNQ